MIDGCGEAWVNIGRSIIAQTSQVNDGIEARKGLRRDGANVIDKQAEIGMHGRLAKPILAKKIAVKRDDGVPASQQLLAKWNANIATGSCYQYPSHTTSSTLRNKVLL